MTQKTRKKTRNFNKPSRLGILAVVGCIMASLAMIYALISHQNMTQTMESLAEMNFQINMKQARLEFCLDNDIRPCDDESINDFSQRTENKSTDNTPRP